MYRMAIIVVPVENALNGCKIIVYKNDLIFLRKNFETGCIVISIIALDAFSPYHAFC